MMSSKASSALFLLYAGLLSFVCAEVFSGASALWIIQPWSWFVTFPLYLVHFLFFVTLAERTWKISTGAVYLWGCIFGLYETWLTKVIWAGYGHDGKLLLGDIGGYGLHETAGLVLFFHAIASFLIPLAILTHLFPRATRPFGVMTWLFQAGWTFRVVRGYLIASFAVISGYNLQNPQVALGTWLPTLLFCWGGYKLLMRRSVDDNARLVLSGRGLKICAMIMVCMYAGMYFLLFPENLPEWYVQLAAIPLYGGLLFLLYRKPSIPPQKSVEDDRLEPTHLFRYLLLISGLSVMFNLFHTVAPQITAPVFYVMIIAMIPAGIVFLIWLGIRKTV